MPRLANVLEERRTALETEENEIIARAEEAGDFTPEQRERRGALAEQIALVESDLAAENARLGRTRTEQAVPVDDAQPGAITPLGAYGSQPRSFGDTFLGSEEWQEYRARVAPNGFSPGSRYESPKVEVPASFMPRRGVGALVTGGSATSAGALTIPDQSGIFDPGTFERELTIRDVITTGTTDSDVVEFVRVTGYTNLAAPVAEADSIDPTDNTGRKPFSDLTLQRVAEVVKTIAHGVPATTRALSDAGQARTIIDNFLRYGLAEELEDQIVSGSGDGENFRGILDYVGAGLQEQEWDTDVLTTTRRAKTKVRVGGKARASFYLFHPNDWEEIDLEMTLAGPGTNYRQAGEVTEPRLHGLRVVESEGVPEGTGIVGDGRMAVLWDRQQTTIQASSGYLDFFMKNLVAILAEMRAAFGVIRPEAFVSIDLTAGGS
ncbi:MAG TPA: phage major capsid protein [Candidatus Limnocylindrales bacterium]|nr:phage major capsid protein [Candidatus Limnocylindrales bacterium]